MRIFLVVESLIEKEEKMLSLARGYSSDRVRHSAVAGAM